VAGATGRRQWHTPREGAYVMDRRPRQALVAGAAGRRQWQGPREGVSGIRRGKAPVTDRR